MRSGVLLGLTRENTPSGRLPVTFSGDAHLLTVARPGSGKSRSVAMANLIRYRGSMIVCDFGGHLAKDTALWRGAALRQYVKIVDPFHIIPGAYIPIYGDKPCFGSVNGIDIIRSSDSPVTTAIAIAESFIPPGGLKESHWSEAAQLRMAASALFVAFDPAIDEMGYPRNMETLWLSLSNPDFEEESLALMMTSKDSFIADQPKAFYESSEHNTEIQNIRNQLRVNCAGTFSEQRILNTMRETNIEFFRMNLDPMTVYLVLPGHLSPRLFRFLRYFLTICLSEIERSGARDMHSSQPKTLFMMDEFPTLGKFPIILDAMATMRKYGATFHIMVQTLSQLLDLYGQGWKKISGNADVIQYFGGTNDTFTADEISKICGVQTIQTISVSHNERPGNSGGTTINETSRAVYTPDEIMRVPLPQQIIKVTGMNPMRELLFNPDLRDFPDYLAFIKANAEGLLLSQAVICAQRASNAQRWLGR